jgi:hypothetical protein
MQSQVAAAVAQALLALMEQLVAVETAEQVLIVFQLGHQQQVLV